MPTRTVASPRVVSLRNARMVKNKEAFDALYAGIADGLIMLGEDILADAVRKGARHRDPEAAQKRGVPMMIDTGRVSVFAPVDGKSKIVYGSLAVTQAQNRGKGVRNTTGQVVMFVGFTSPLAHFLELGTVKERADPFLTPAVMANIANAGPYVKGAMSRYAATAGERAERNAGIKARKADAKARRAVSPDLMAAIQAEADRR